MRTLVFGLRINDARLRSPSDLPPRIWPRRRQTIWRSAIYCPTPSTAHATSPGSTSTRTCTAARCTPTPATWSTAASTSCPTAARSCCPTWRRRRPISRCRTIWPPPIWRCATGDGAARPVDGEHARALPAAGRERAARRPGDQRRLHRSGRRRVGGDQLDRLLLRARQDDAVHLRSEERARARLVHLAARYLLLRRADGHGDLAGHVHLDRRRGERRGGDRQRGRDRRSAAGGSGNRRGDQASTTWRSPARQQPDPTELAEQQKRVVATHKIVVRPERRVQRHRVRRRLARLLRVPRRDQRVRLPWPSRSTSTTSAVRAAATTRPTIPRASTATCTAWRSRPPATCGPATATSCSSYRSAPRARSPTSSWTSPPASTCSYVKDEVSALAGGRAGRLVRGLERQRPRLPGARHLFAELLVEPQHAPARSPERRSRRSRRRRLHRHADDGVVRYRPSAGTWTYYRQSTGLPSDHVRRRYTSTSIRRRRVRLLRHRRGHRRVHRSLVHFHPERSAKRGVEGRQFRRDALRLRSRFASPPLRMKIASSASRQASCDPRPFPRRRDRARGPGRTGTSASPFSPRGLSLAA